MDSLEPRWAIDAKVHLRQLFGADASSEDGDNTAGALLSTGEVEPTHSDEYADCPSALKLPFDGSTDDELALAKGNRASWNLLEEHRQSPDPPSASRGYRRVSDVYVSTTDPDATPMRKSNGDGVRLGYHHHHVVDGGKARIILRAFVTPADVMDNAPMLDLLHRVVFRWHLHPRRAIADAKYGTIENIVALEESGIRAYMPLPDFDKRTEYYGPSQFRYDPDADLYWCPQGQPLPRYFAKNTEHGVMYRADASVYNACPVKAARTPSKAGRSLRRSLFTPHWTPAAVAGVREEPMTPLRNVAVTIPCPVCAQPFTPAGRQRVCSTACRQAAWRRRQAAPLPSIPRRPGRANTIYACPTCDARSLGDQRCADCGTFCRKLGPGTPRPHCDEPVLLADLLVGMEAGEAVHH